MIQGGTDNTPVSAIPAAVASNTQLLLGLWASAGQEQFNQELTALKNAIQQYPKLAQLVQGISVGSEDLYRVSPTGIKNKSGVGAGPATVADYIRQVRELISGTALSGAPIGHVDTWNSWVNETNSAVAQACDWVGVNEFPYFQTTDGNPIQNAGKLFYKALSDTRGAVGGKPIWVTETGWPYQGPKSGQAIASTQNARSYWEQVYCTLPADVHLFWYTQRDANAGDSAQFGLTDQTLSTTPRYDLTCNKQATSSSAVSASATATASSSGSSSTSTSGTGNSGAVVGGSNSGNSDNGSDNDDNDNSSSGDNDNDTDNGSGSSSNGSDNDDGDSSSGSSGSSGNGSSSNNGGNGGDDSDNSGSSGSGSGSSGSGSSGSGSSGSGAGSSGSNAGSGGNAGSATATATSGPAYPTASGMSTAIMGTGTGALPQPTSTLTPYAPNSGSSVRSTFALLAIPALVAMML